MAAYEFEGQTFTLRDGPVPEFIMLEMAELASDGADADAGEGGAALMRFLRECIAPEDWGRFRRVCRTLPSISERVQPLIEARMQNTAVAERPTGQPSDFTDGPSPIAVKSVLNSDAKVLELSLGRPDRLAMLREAQASSA